MDNQELLKEVTNLLQQQTETLNWMMNEHTHEIKLMIENDVAKRIDAI